MFHFFFCQNFLSRYLRINHCNWSLASDSDKTNTSVFTYLVWVLRPSVLMRMSKWKFSQEAKQTGKESLRLLLKSSFLLILWYLNKIVTGFNSTLRQGNITHHEYIQVCFCLSFFFFGRELLIIFVSWTHLYFLEVLLFNAGWKGKRCWIEPDCSIWGESCWRKWRASPK